MIDTSPWDPSEWWIVVFTNTELPAGAARYKFPKGKATGGAIVHQARGLPDARAREMALIAWDTVPEHVHMYQLANREADEIAPVEKLLSAEEAARIWNEYATDKKA